MIKKIIDNLSKANGAKVICLSGLPSENSQKIINDIINHFSIPVSEIWQSAESPLSIGEVRNLIKWIVQIPIYGENKIAVLELDNIKHEAANALLKTLEEPPKYAIIVATISEQGKLLPTIKSRVQLYYTPGRQSQDKPKTINGSFAVAFAGCAAEKNNAGQVIDGWISELRPEVRKGRGVNQAEELLEYKSLSQINCNPKILLGNAFLSRYKEQL